MLRNKVVVMEILRFLFVVLTKQTLLFLINGQPVNDMENGKYIGQTGLE